MVPVLSLGLKTQCEFLLTVWYFCHHPGKMVLFSLRRSIYGADPDPTPTKRQAQLDP